MSWHKQKEEFQKRFDNLGEKKNNDIFTDLKSAVDKYILNEYTKDKNELEYNNIIKLKKQADDIKKEYSDLNQNIIQYVSNESKNDISTLLIENGDIQKKIKNLEKVQDEMKVDVESAIARDDLLRSRDTDMSRHKLFLLERPVRKGILPYLWVISVLFIGIGLFIYKKTFPNFGIFGSVGLSGSGGSVIEFLTSKIVLGSLLIGAVITILFLSLRVGGVI